MTFRNNIGHTRLRDLWRDYKRTRDWQCRAELLEMYLPVVKYQAERLSTRLPDEVDVDDLISAGVFGLMNAIDAFDVDRGVKFEMYCAPRIRGAILDELRMMEWVPRLARSRAYKLDSATKTLEIELGRLPTEAELREFMRMSREEFDKLLKDATAVSVVSQSRNFYETDSHKGAREIDILEDNRGRDPVMEPQLRDLKALMTRGLTRAERLILVMYYYEEMTMEEIGKALDLSESRVRQMHSSIVARLRSMIECRRLAGGIGSSDKVPASRQWLREHLPHVSRRLRAVGFEERQPIPKDATLQVFLEMGNATSDDIAGLLTALSDLYEAMGGPPLVISADRANGAPNAGVGT